ncbi:MAG: ATP-binding protein [Candidatus Micrarchaeota archaeon]
MGSAFIRRFESSVKNTLQRYSLASRGDLVLVACSGGKDSTTVLNILHALGYDVEAIHIDLGIGAWSKANKANIESFCEGRGIPMHAASTRECLGFSVCYLKSSLQQKTCLSACSICGVIKKWVLNRKAKELGADRLATGHNLDDEARTLMMNVINGNPDLCLHSRPKREGRGKLFVPRIKPLYFASEDSIKRYSMEMGFHVLYERCPCSKDSFGRGIYDEVGRLGRYVPDIKDNMVKSSLWLQHRCRKGESESARACRLCGEPSRAGVCRTCSMLFQLRNDKE